MESIVLVFGAILVIVLLVFLYLFLQDTTETAGSGLPWEFRALVTVTRPLIRFVISPILRLTPLRNDGAVGQQVRAKLMGAGIYDLSPEEYLSLQFLLVILLTSFFFGMGSVFLPMALNICITAMAVLVGTYYPFYKITQQQQRRKDTIFAELPYVVDLLSLGIESGLDFRRAVERLVSFSEESPLINELKLFLQDLELGTSMSDALKKMAERVDVLAFFSFVEALIQATQMGVDVTPTLRAQAEQMRVTYFQQLEKQANATPLLLMAPTMICIFPPMFILLLTPAVVRIVEEWRLAMGK